MANSVYGVTGTATNGNSFNFGGHFEAKLPEDVYCEFCYNKIDDWFMNNPLGCFKCDEGLNPDAKFINKEEMRNRKLDLLSDEQ